jgi:cyclohexa-1,5-dienecarbonyl-CoA hydratase
MYPPLVSHRFERIAVETQPPVARITLAHPPLNVIDIPMMDELSSALAQIEENRSVSTILLAGSDKAFSAGVDAAAHKPEQIHEMLGKFHAIFKSLVASRKVSVAEVRGHCLGGGAELAMICDAVYTSEDAVWGFPEIKLGCFPPVAATALAALVGQKQAAELILTGRTISGTIAAQIGLATGAWPGEQISGVVAAFLADVTQLSHAAIAVTKKAIYAWDSMHFDKGLARAEKIYLEDLMKTSDAREGIRAFLEKRTPRWEGK